MKETIEIGWLELSIGYGLFLIPLYLLWYFKTGLLKASVIACLRMTFQLLLVGYYLEFVFTLDNPFLNIAWLLVMTIIGATTITKRSGLNVKIFALPVFIALFSTVFFTNLYLLVAVVKPDNFFEARYLIPISGMMLGNSMRHNIVALSDFYQSLMNNKNYYYYLLANGATKQEALLPYWKNALKLAINPAIAQMAVMGLISLPGMMTGQILGGNLPNTAIRYQLLIIIAIFFLAVVSISLSIYISNYYVLNKDGTFKKKQFLTGKPKKKKGKQNH